MSTIYHQGVPIYEYPSWSAELRNEYWHIRYVTGRRPSEVRRRYRRVIKCKRKLEAAGVNAEWIRLLCLHLADPKRAARTENLIKFEVAMKSRFWLEHPQNVRGYGGEKRPIKTWQLCCKSN